VLHHPRVTVLSWTGAALAAVRLSRVSPTPFEGCSVGKLREWAAQCLRMTPAIPHNTDTAPGMAAQRWVGPTVLGSDSHAVSGG
jgi:hypothetical protein